MKKEEYKMNNNDFIKEVSLNNSENIVDLYNEIKVTKSKLNNLKNKINKYPKSYPKTKMFFQVLLIVCITLLATILSTIIVADVIPYYWLLSFLLNTFIGSYGIYYIHSYYKEQLLTRKDLEIKKNDLQEKLDNEMNLYNKLKWKTKEIKISYDQNQNNLSEENIIDNYQIKDFTRRLKRF